jgi:hypothetical protein
MSQASLPLDLNLTHPIDFPPRFFSLSVVYFGPKQGSRLTPVYVLVARHTSPPASLIRFLGI